VELAALLLERCDKREMTDEETGEVLVEMNAIAERFGGPWVATGPSPDAGRAIFVALAELLGFELEDWVASMVMALAVRRGRRVPRGAPMNAVETQLDLATRAFFAALAAVGVEAGTVVFRAHGSEPVLIARGRHADLLDAGARAGGPDHRRRGRGRQTGRAGRPRHRRIRGADAGAGRVAAMSAHAESEMVFECQARPFLESLPKQVLVRLVLVSNPHLSFEQFEMLRWYGYRLMELDREAQGRRAL
jgi:hypothetical protein